MFYRIMWGAGFGAISIIAIALIEILGFKVSEYYKGYAMAWFIWLGIVLYDDKIKDIGRRN